MRLEDRTDRRDGMIDAMENIGILMKRKDIDVVSPTLLYIFMDYG